MPFGKAGGDMGRECKVAAQLIKSTPGPIARKVDDLECFLRVAMSKEAYSLAKFNAPIQYSLELSHSTNQLRIGYFDDSDLFKISQSSRRALSIAKSILEKGGHQVVKFDIGSLKQGLLGLARVLSLDQGKMAAQNLVYEPGQNKAISNTLLFSKLPKFAVRFISQFYKWKKDSFGDFILQESKGQEYIKNLIHRREYSEQFIEKMMGREKGEQQRPPLDALICPSMPFPPPFLQTYSEQYNLTAAYIAFFNYVGCPAGVIPITTILEEEEKWDPVANGQNLDSVSSQIRMAMQNSKGLPVSVQVASLPYHEEIIIRLMREIESGLQE